MQNEEGRSGLVAVSLYKILFHFKALLWELGKDAKLKKKNELVALARKEGVTG